MEAILPGNSHKRHLRFLCSCVLLLVVLSPLVSVFSSTEIMEESISQLLDVLNAAESSGAQKGEALIQAYGQEAVEKQVKEILQDEFSIAPEEVEVQLEALDGIPWIHVILRGQSSWSDSTRVAGALKDKLNCQIKITRK
ncbi:MAG: stage III sporulation protein AF [Clostridia bacterium]|nr:stage III sporulation protein AF [Clostridia bacterium]